MKEEHLTRHTITEDTIKKYLTYLREAEKSEATAEKYGRALRSLLAWLTQRERDTQGELSKEALLRWKRELAESYAAGTVNTMLAAVNGYLDFSGFPQYRIKPLKVQRRIFRDRERELTRAEYMRLIETAKREGNHRLALIMETLGSTGIRISELRFITAEAVRYGEATVNCKGKRRPVLLPKNLRRLLRDWCKGQGITAGSVFITSGGRPVDRSNVWHEMKRICQKAGVDSRKVFPHNLRHLFAVVYYKATRDIAKLADLLGHASITTTRIYLMESGLTHRRQIERLGLVV